MSFDLYELIEAMERVIPRAVEDGVSDALAGLGDGKRRAVQLLKRNEIGVYALCNDGSIWSGDSSRGWLRLPDIPQDEVPT